MASPDAIILLILDYHAATGGKTPRAPFAFSPVHNWDLRFSLIRLSV